MRFKHIEGQLARWLEELAQFDMEIIPRPGKLHGNSDGMSRVPDTLTECDCYSAGAELEKLPCGGCKYCTRAHNQWPRFDSDVDDVIPLSKKVIVNTVFPSQSMLVSQSKDPDLIRSDTSQEQDTSTLSSQIDLDATWPYVEQDEDPDMTKMYFEGERRKNFNNWLPEYSSIELRQLQEEDDDISPIVQWLETGEAPSQATLRLSSPATRFLWLGQFCLEFHNDILYYKYVDRTDKELSLVVPDKLKHEILQHCHDDKVAGHLGKDKTIQRIKQYFIWHQMGSDIMDYVLTCNICNRHKNVNLNPRHALQAYHAGSPMKRLHIDILGPINQSGDNNRYVLMMIDQFTKWVEMAAIPEQSALLTAKKVLVHFIATFGWPLEIHTDQGRSFESKLFGSLCELLE